MNKATAVAVAPLVVVNALAVYGQGAYAFETIAPDAWNPLARLVLAIGFAAAVESVALYVGWHAHDALLLKAYGTARRLRRWAFVVALAAAGMNYAHFAAPALRPTPAALAFAMLSLLSPWMWGLHSRRQAHVQLLAERRADEAGVEFSSQRRRMFPVHTWKAARYAMWRNITDPADAWTAYRDSRDVPGELVPPEVPDALDMSETDTLDTSEREDVPRSRTSTGRVPWDVEKVVRLVQEGRFVLASEASSPKNVQRVRNVVDAIGKGFPDDSIVRPGNISLGLVQRVRAAMEVTE